MLSKIQRSILMSRVRNKDTAPELVVRKALFKAGLRYRIHVKTLPGSPDLVFHKYRCVVFVNGCFWHGHEGCRKARLPTSNERFWKEKIIRNKRHDSEVNERLNELGWRVIIIWQCQIKEFLSNIANYVDSITKKSTSFSESRPYWLNENSAEIRRQRLVEAIEVGILPGTLASESGFYLAIGPRGGKGEVVYVEQGGLMPSTTIPGSRYIQYTI